MKSPGEKAVTVTEVLVAIVVIIFLLSLLSAPVTFHGPPSQSTQALSNMRKLYTATFMMAMDATTTGKTNFGWPGDTGGTFSGWTDQLIQGKYLTAEDLSKLLSAPGIVLKPGKIPFSNTTAVRVYALTEGAPGNTVFLTSANFTNTPTGGLPPRADAKPFGSNRFIVFRSGGDGGVYKGSQAGDTNIIGGFAPLCQ